MSERDGKRGAMQAKTADNSVQKHTHTDTHTDTQIYTHTYVDSDVATITNN